MEGGGDVYPGFSGPAFPLPGHIADVNTKLFMPAPIHGPIHTHPGETYEIVVALI
jgi:hypothetical protein